MPRAIARAHQRIGVMPCLVCAREIPVKKTDGGKLSCACQWCDAPIYINQGSEAYELVMKRVKLDAPAAAAATSSPPPKDPPENKQPAGPVVVAAPAPRGSWANPLAPAWK